MGLDNLTDRADDTRTDEEHFNLLKRALSGDHVPRDSSGTTTDVSSDLGSTSFSWVNFFLQTLKLRNSGFYSQLQSASSIASSFTAYLFSALPVKKAAIKIAADGTMTAADPNSGLSGSTAAFTTTSTTDIDVGISQALTTRGNPVLLLLVPDGSSPAEISLGGTSRPYVQLQTSFYRDALPVAVMNHKCDVELTGATNMFASIGATMLAVDFPPAGLHTYTVKVNKNYLLSSGTDSYNMSNMKLFALELF